MSSFSTIFFPQTHMYLKTRRFSTGSHTVFLNNIRFGKHKQIWKCIVKRSFMFSNRILIKNKNVVYEKVPNFSFKKHFSYWFMAESRRLSNKNRKYSLSIFNLFYIHVHVIYCGILRVVSNSCYILLCYSNIVLIKIIKKLSKCIEYLPLIFCV